MATPNKAKIKLALGLMCDARDSMAKEDPVDVVKFTELQRIINQLYALLEGDIHIERG